MIYVHRIKTRLRLNNFIHVFFTKILNQRSQVWENKQRTQENTTITHSLILEDTSNRLY